eukprot:364074-Chlamydomonas_euryale.AAC.5
MPTFGHQPAWPKCGAGWRITLAQLLVLLAAVLNVHPRRPTFHTSSVCMSTFVNFSPVLARPLAPSVCVNFRQLQPRVGMAACPISVCQLLSGSPNGRGVATERRAARKGCA